MSFCCFHCKACLIILFFILLCIIHTKQQDIQQAQQSQYQTPHNEQQRVQYQQQTHNKSLQQNPPLSLVSLYLSQTRGFDDGNNCTDINFPCQSLRHIFNEINYEIHDALHYVIYFDCTLFKPITYPFSIVKNITLQHISRRNNTYDGSKCSFQEGSTVFFYISFMNNLFFNIRDIIIDGNGITTTLIRSQSSKMINIDITNSVLTGMHKIVDLSETNSIPTCSLSLHNVTAATRSLIGTSFLLNFTVVDSYIQCMATAMLIPRGVAHYYFINSTFEKLGLGSFNPVFNLHTPDESINDATITLKSCKFLNQGSSLGSIIIDSLPQFVSLENNHFKRFEVKTIAMNQLVQNNIFEHFSSWRMECKRLLPKFILDRNIFRHSSFLTVDSCLTDTKYPEMIISNSEFHHNNFYEFNVSPLSIFNTQHLIFGSISLLIQNCTFYQNIAGEGAAIGVMHSHIAIKSSAFTNNGALREGTIFSDDYSVLHISNCSFLDNIAIETGGAITSSASQFVIEHSVFERNIASSGGSLFLQSGSVDISQSHFLGNIAVEGGCIMGYGLTNSISIQSSMFHSCSSHQDGGAIHLIQKDGDILLQDLRFFNCTAGDEGGALVIRGFDQTAAGRLSKVLNCHFSSCSASLGGAASFQDRSLILQGSIFTNNSASLAGGGILFISMLRIFDTLFKQNTAVFGGAFSVPLSKEDSRMVIPKFVGKPDFSDNRAQIGENAFVTSEFDKWFLELPGVSKAPSNLSINFMPDIIHYGLQFSISFCYVDDSGKTLDYFMPENMVFRFQNVTPIQIFQNDANTLKDVISEAPNVLHTATLGVYQIPDLILRPFFPDEQHLNVKVFIYDNFSQIAQIDIRTGCDFPMIPTSNGVCKMFTNTVEGILALIGFSIVIAILIVTVFLISCLIIVRITRSARSRRRRSGYHSFLDQPLVNISQLKLNPLLFSINFKDIEILEEIGSNANLSATYKGKWRKQEVCVKLFKAMNSIEEGDDTVKVFESELKVIFSLKHTNIIHFYGGCLKSPCYGVVCEFCEMGNLGQYINNVKLSFERKVSLLCEIAETLQYIHRHNIIHRNLKLENIMVLDEDGKIHIKITDFGVMKLILSNDYGTSATPRRNLSSNIYCSPEITLLKNSITEKADVFSFAILMFNLFFETANPYMYNQDIKSFDFNIEMRVANDPWFRPLIPTNSRDYNEPEKIYLTLMRKCWSHDPTVRPSFQQVISELEVIMNLIKTTKRVSNTLPIIEELQATDVTTNSLTSSPIFGKSPAEDLED